MVYLKNFEDAVSYHKDKFDLPQSHIVIIEAGGEIFYGEIFTIINVTYQVESSEAPIQILGLGSRLDLITEMYVDGGEIQDPAYYHKFSEPGEHQIRYVTKRRTLDFSEFLDGCVNVLSVNLGQARTYYHDAVNLGCMFSGCNLVSSIDLSSLDTTDVYSISGIFKGCSNLSEVTMYYPVDNITELEEAFSGVAEVGTFYYNPKYDYSKIINILPPGWVPKELASSYATGVWLDNQPSDDNSI